MAWQPFAVSRRSKTWQDDQNPNKRVIEATIAPLHYASALDGEPDAPVDFTVNQVDNAQLDGWTVNQADWHYALGIDKLNHPGEDGWFAFGGRQGSHWFKFRLERVGYLRYSNLAWTGIGGLPTYTRAGNLSQSTGTIDLLDGQETINVGLNAEWRNLWTTPGGGEAWLEVKADGNRLKVNPVLDQAARDYAATQYPGTGPQQNQYYFGFVFRVDHSDIPRAYKNNVLQSLTGDFDDDDGTSEIFLRDSLDRLLGLLPLDDAIVRDPATGEELSRLRLRKRFYQDGSNTYLLVGARVDLLNTLPTGELIFDPTIDTGVSASGDDVDVRDGGSGFNSTGNTLSVGFHTNSSILQRSAAIRFTGISGLSGATIDTSYLSLYLSNNSTVQAKIRAERADSPSQITSYSDFYARTLTTAGIDWDNETGSGPSTPTPSINSVLQEIADNHNPSEINMFLLDDGTPTDATYQHSIRSYDWDGTGASAPVLHIEYTAAGGGGDPEGSLIGGKLIRGGLLNHGRLVR